MPSPEEELSALRRAQASAHQAHARAVVEFDLHKQRILEIQKTLETLGFPTVEAAEAEIARLDQEIQQELARLAAQAGAPQ